MILTMGNLKIGTVLKRQMTDGRHTLTAISKATGIPKSTLSDWQNGRAPHPGEAAKVANFLGISLHYLLFGTEDAQEPLHRMLKEEFFSGTFEINIKRVKISKTED
jgi:transcriptional regulator with XRE-family HTH domain